MNYQAKSASQINSASLERFSDTSLTSLAKELPKVEIRTIRQFFPETWLWGIKTTEYFVYIIKLFLHIFANNLFEQ
jgi:hypothetical protein